jgi:ElaB/YqjD/DUF883 family membrane-anchored ribosome-binding protein
MNKNDIDQAHQQGSPQDDRTAARKAGQGMRAHDRPRWEMARLREASKNIGQQLEEQVHKRPYVVIGAATGIGFVAGSLLGSRLGQILLAAGLGYAAKNVLEGNMGMERIQESIERLAHERSKG